MDSVYNRSLYLVRLVYVRAQSHCLRFVETRRAVTAIEYALIAALIAVAIISAVTRVGTRASSVFNTIATEL